MIRQERSMSEKDQRSMTSLTPIRDGAWLARQLLTPCEQEYLRKAAEERGMVAPAKEERLRLCSRTEIEDEELA